MADKSIANSTNRGSLESTDKIPISRSGFAEGSIQGSAIINLINAKQNLVSAPTANNILTTNSSGQAIDSGKSFSTDVTMGGGSASDNLIPTQASVASYTTNYAYSKTETDSQIQNGIQYFQTYVSYSFYVNGGAIIFDNGLNIINKDSDSLICTKSGPVGGITFTKGYIYKVNANTSAPNETNLVEFLSLANFKQAIISRDFSDNSDIVYSAGTYQLKSDSSDIELLSREKLFLSIPDLPSGGSIGTAASTVDIYGGFILNQTTPGQAITIPTPTDSSLRAKVRAFTHAGTENVLLGNLLLRPGYGMIFAWSGSSWLGIDNQIVLGNDGTNNTIPTSAQMQAYVIQQVLNTPSLPFVHYATTANITTFSGLGAIDGYTPTAGQFLLVKNQTDRDNSVWIVASGAWTRAFYDDSLGIWSPITTQTTYSELNINGGVLNVINGTTGKNLQFQFSIINESATFGNTTVYLTATTKIPPRDVGNGYVSNNAGNNTNFNGTASFPYLTVAQDLIGAQFPHITNIAPSGGVYTEIMSITSAQPNFSLIANDTLDAGKTQFSNPLTLQTGNTRYKEKGITRSTGGSTPIVLAAGNLGRHSFENCIWTTSGTSLMSINANVINWVNLYNIDAGGSPLASIPLPDFTTNFTFNIYNQTRYLPFSLVSGATGANCTINVFNSIKGAVVVPNGFSGSFNYYDGYSVNQIITDQSTLTSILADTSISGFYAVSFSSPTGMEAGCIFAKISAGGFTVNNIAERFASGKTSTIYDINTKKTYLKDGSGSFNAWVLPGGGSSYLNTLLDTNISSPSDGNILQYSGADSKWHNAIIQIQTIDPIVQSRANAHGMNLIRTTNGKVYSIVFNQTAYPSSPGSGRGNSRNTPSQNFGIPNPAQIIFYDSVIDFYETGKAIDIHVQGENIFVLFDSGNLWGWGTNAFGQLGLGNTTAVTSPRRLRQNVTKIFSHSSGASDRNNYAYSRTVIQGTDGYLYACGENSQGGLGLGNYTATINTFTQLTWAGQNPISVWNLGTYLGFILVEKDEGIVSGVQYSSYWASGYNAYGQLGKGDTTQINTPVNITSYWTGQGSGSTAKTSKRIMNVGFGGGYYDATTYYNYTSLLLWMRETNSGGANPDQIRSCGAGNWYQLGNGLTGAISTPYTVSLNSSTTYSIKEFVNLAGGSPMTLHVLLNNGNLYTWGHNGGGQCAIGNNNYCTTPTLAKVSNAGVASNFSCSHLIYSDTYGASINSTQGWFGTMFAQGTDGYYYSCGKNDMGQAGVGSTTDLTYFTKMRFPSGVSFDIFSWMTGEWYNRMNPIFINSSKNEIWSWGNGTYGAFGQTMETSHKLSPVKFKWVQD